MPFFFFFISECEFETRWENNSNRLPRTVCILKKKKKIQSISERKRFFRAAAERKIYRPVQKLDRETGSGLCSGRARCGPAGLGTSGLSLNEPTCEPLALYSWRRDYKCFRCGPSQLAFYSRVSVCPLVYLRIKIFSPYSFKDISKWIFFLFRFPASLFYPGNNSVRSRKNRQNKY